MPDLELGDLARRLQLTQASVEIALQTETALIPVRRLLGHQPANDIGQHFRHRGIDVARGNHRLRHVGVDQRQGVRGLERHAARHHFEESRTQRVEVGSIILGSVDPARLFR